VWSYALWILSPDDRPAPGVYKRAVIRRYARKHRTPTFVETGTLYGGTLHAVRGSFAELYSIEIDQSLAVAAQRRFDHDPGVSVILGDSADQIPELIKRLDSPTLFWLDGHYSGEGTGRGDEDSPLVAEVTSILRDAAACVVLVDDARFLGTGNGYPSFDELAQIVASLRPAAHIETKRDIVRIEAMKSWDRAIL
jgi:hypothetical protein